MMVLPIVGRELRVRARSRTSYWSRFWVGLLSSLVGLPPLLWLGFSPGSAAAGRGVFVGFVAAAFLLACGACLATADSISAERRAGTLGLLFLTRIKGFDLLLGKFASNGLTCLFAMVAFLPVLMIPILAGGVAGGEAVRKGLVLLATLFLSLSAGLVTSTRSYERLSAARNAVSLVLVLVLLPILLGRLAQWTTLELASPLGAMVAGNDTLYKAAPGRFWFSLAIVQAVGGALLYFASASLRARLNSGDDLQGAEFSSTSKRNGSKAPRPAGGEEVIVPVGADAQAGDIDSSPRRAEVARQWDYPPEPIRCGGCCGGNGALRAWSGAPRWRASCNWSCPVCLPASWAPAGSPLPCLLYFAWREW